MVAPVCAVSDERDRDIAPVPQRDVWIVESLNIDVRSMWDLRVQGDAARAYARRRRARCGVCPLGRLRNRRPGSPATTRARRGAANC